MLTGKKVTLGVAEGKRGIVQKPERERPEGCDWPRDRSGKECPWLQVQTKQERRDQCVQEVKGIGRPGVSRA